MGRSCLVEGWADIGVIRIHRSAQLLTFLKVSHCTATCILHGRMLHVTFDKLIILPVPGLPWAFDWSQYTGKYLLSVLQFLITTFKINTSRKTALLKTLNDWLTTAIISTSTWHISNKIGLNSNIYYILSNTLHKALVLSDWLPITLFAVWAHQEHG